MRVLLVVSLCLTVTLVALSQGSPISLSLPDWTGGAECSIRVDNRIVATVQGRGRLPFTCPARGERISCDIIGAEPVDIALASVCERAELPLLRATSSVVVAGTDGGMTVDWLSVDAVGRVAVVATRNAGSERTTLSLAASPTRLLRFSRSGFSPLTVPSLQLPVAEVWRVPPFERGGELVVQHSAATIIPLSYRLIRNGAASMHVRRRNEFTAVAGLSAGVYQLASVYAGGVPGRTQRVDVEETKSTFVLVPKEDVGGVSIRLHSAICAETSRIQIRQLSIESVTMSDGGLASRILSSDAATVQPVNDCEPVIAGLVPGDYEFVLDKRQGSASVRRRFLVASDVLTELTIEPAGTRLSGKVSLNGRPLTQATVEFVPKGSSRPAARANTDDRGNYAAEFDTPGPYHATLRLRGVPVAGQQKLIEVPAGETTFDWAVTGGTVTVRIENVASSGAGGVVSISLDQIAPAVVDGRPGFFHTIRPDDPEMSQGKLTFRGLGFGSYALKARQQPVRSGDRTRTSREVRFSLSEQSPDASITIGLDHNFGQIVLTDPVGNPIRGANVYATGVIARETDPGTYSMDGITPGIPLQIRAPAYTPLCRLAPETSVTVVLDPGRTVEVQFPGLDGKQSSPLGRMSWRGAECPIALDGFPFTKLVTEGNGVPRFSISNFPLVGDVSHSFLSEPARSYQVLYGVLVIPAIKK